MAGGVVHFEIPADDEGRAREFYSSAFGWEISSVPEMSYAMIKTTPTDATGMPSVTGSINGGMFRREGDLTSPVVTVDVEDIDAALETIDLPGRQHRLAAAGNRHHGLGRPSGTPKATLSVSGRTPRATQGPATVVPRRTTSAPEGGT